jgi:hypothetical protein
MRCGCFAAADVVGWSVVGGEGAAGVDSTISDNLAAAAC